VQGNEIPAKISNDLLPTMKNGWKFWIPAASLNFYAIPLEYQVLGQASINAQADTATMVSVSDPLACACPLRL
jgi:hypothetical protein